MGIKEELIKKHMPKAKDLGLDHVHEITGNPMNGYCIVCKKNSGSILMGKGAMEPFIVLDELK